MRARFLAVVAAGVLLLSGCETRIATTFSIREGALAGEITVVFAEDAAGITEQTVEEIRGVVRERLPEAEVRIERGEGSTVLRVRASAAALTKEPGITGVGSVSASNDHGEWRVSVGMEVPAELIAAITEGVKGEQDEAALLRVALGSTRVEAWVRLDGITEARYAAATGGGWDAEIADGAAGWGFDLSEPQSGTLTVRGRERVERGVNWWALGGAVGVLVIIAVSGRRRRG